MPAAHALFLVLMLMPMQNAQIDDQLKTTAEKSEYAETSTSAQVENLIERIREQSSIMRVTELGKTSEGKSIPLVILANPPVEVAGSELPSVAGGSRPICFVMANIHAGEVEGKEASLMLIRELALNPDHPLLKKLVIVFAPNYNADGNDKFDDVAKNRPGQVGPAHCGIRANAEGLDLNRDYIKLEAPETRSLVKFFTEWDPLITIDCHTTDGSHHRYLLTYEAPLNPSGHAVPIDFVRNQLLPEVTKRVRKSTGYDMWHYGNFNADHPPTIWETYSAQPRFGGQYQGLRGEMTVLSEAYSYAPFKDRVIATREFIREILQYTSEHADEMMKTRQRAKDETIAKGRNPQSKDMVGIRHQIAAFPEKVLVKGYAGSTGGVGGAVITSHDNLGEPKDYLVEHRGYFEPTLSVVRPYAYIIPPGFDRIVEKLRQHGIAIEPYASVANVEIYTITRIERDEHEFQGHRTVRLDATAKQSTRQFAKGSMIVRTAQPLGTLAVYLLEPQSEDGLATWNFFDDQLREGGEFPIVRVRSANDLR